MTILDDCHIQTAIAAAKLSPCRSKRGVALFDARTGAHRGDGYNGPPAGYPCPGREICAGTCGQRCVHAEVRAIRDALQLWIPNYGGGSPGELDLVHIELANPGPTIEQLAAKPPAWMGGRADSAEQLARWSSEQLHRSIVASIVASTGPSCWQCAREILDVGFVGGVWLYELSDWLGLRIPEPDGKSHWRRYTATEFYEISLKNCGMKS